MESNFSELLEIYNDPKNLTRFLTPPPPLVMFNGLPIHFDKNFKKIGISFSGGADSSLLLYILCKLIKESGSECKIYPITMVRFFRDKPWLEHIAKDVYNYIKAEFPDIIEPIEWGFIPPEFEIVKISKLGLNSSKTMQYNTSLAHCDVYISNEFVQYQIYKHNLDCVYNGVTTNPPIETNNEPKFRNSEIVGKDFTKVCGPTKICPFALITKDWIMAQYKNLNLEKLLNLTRSCTYGEADVYKRWKKGDKYPPACLECFFCQERSWAIDNSDKYIIKES